MSNLAKTSTISPETCFCDFRPRNIARFRLGNRGLTLLEVMVSAFIMALTLIAFLGTVIQAYRVDETARRRDQVRAVLQSFVDQFNRGAITYVDPADSVKKIYAFFDPLKSPTPTGFGLEWTDSMGVLHVGVAGDPSLKLRLGDEATAPEVTITRQVKQMNEVTGEPGGSTTPLESSELYCEFTATWAVEKHPQSLVLRVLRCANATGINDPSP